MCLKNNLEDIVKQVVVMLVEESIVKFQSSYLFIYLFIVISFCRL